MLTYIYLVFLWMGCESDRREGTAHHVSEIPRADVHNPLIFMVLIMIAAYAYSLKVFGLAQISKCGKFLQTLTHFVLLHDFQSLRIWKPQYHLLFPWLLNVWHKRDVVLENHLVLYFKWPSVCCLTFNNYPQHMSFTFFTDYHIKFTSWTKGSMEYSDCL